MELGGNLYLNQQFPYVGHFLFDYQKERLILLNQLQNNTYNFPVCCAVIVKMFYRKEFRMRTYAYLRDCRILK